jgi:hypothetical protein
MTIAFNCPGCGNPFRVADEMAGKKGKCPKCGTITTIPSGAGVPAPTRSAPPPPPMPVQTRPSAPPPPPRAVAPPPPPASASPFADMVADEQPADDDTMPRRRRRKSSLMLPLLIFGGILILAGGGLALWLFWPSGLGSEMKFMPSDAQALVSIKVDELLNSAVWKDAAKENKEIENGLAMFEKASGIPLKDIERVTLGVPKEPDHMIAAVRTKTAHKASELTAALAKSDLGEIKFKESKVGSFTVYEPEVDGPPAFCVAEDKLIVVGMAKDLKAVLERNKKPEFSSGLQSALKQADFGKTVTFAASAKGLIPKGGKAPPGLDVDKIEGFAGWIKVGSDVQVEASVLCSDSKTADSLKTAIEGMLGFVKALPDVPKEINDIKFSTSGSRVVARVTVKGSTLTELIKKGGLGMFGFGGGGGEIPMPPPGGFEGEMPKDAFPKDAFPKDVKMPKDAFKKGR